MAQGNGEEAGDLGLLPSLSLAPTPLRKYLAWLGISFLNCKIRLNQMTLSSWKDLPHSSQQDVPSPHLEHPLELTWFYVFFDKHSTVRVNSLSLTGLAGPTVEVGQTNSKKWWHDCSLQNDQRQMPYNKLFWCPIPTYPVLYHPQPEAQMVQLSIWTNTFTSPSAKDIPGLTPNHRITCYGKRFSGRLPYSTPSVRTIIPLLM